MRNSRKTFRERLESRLKTPLLAAAVTAVLWCGGNPNPGRAEEARIESSETPRIVYVNFQNPKTKEIVGVDSEYIFTLAKMLFGEARNCADEEKVAIAYTALNRVRKHTWYGKTLIDVITKPYQYSCFNENDPNRKLLEEPEKHDLDSWNKSIEVAYEVIEGIAKGNYNDPTNGATHYYNPKHANPKWAKSDKMTKIGKLETSDGESKHVFYKEL